MPPASQAGMHTAYTTDTINKGRRHKCATARFSLLIDKRHVPHGQRLVLGIHQHLMPSAQNNRLVI